MEIVRIEKSRSTCLIGNIVSDRIFDRRYVECITRRMWHCNFRVTEVKGNIFVFYFDKNEDCYRVLRDAPWTFQVGGLLLILSPLFSSNNIPSELSFYYSPFWVQVHGLPSYSFTEENAIKIGQYLGQYMCVDKSVWGKFLRIRVRLDVRNPLLTGFWFSSMWIPFKYEKLGMFCYKCGRIGNHQDTCKFPPGNERFGPWLRVEWRVECSSNNQLVVKKHSENFTLIPSPNLLAWRQVEADEHLDNPENTTPSKNEWARLTINGVDSIFMMVNCGVIACRVAEANEFEGYSWLIFMMVAYFFYLVLKFNVMVRRFYFFQKSNSSEGSFMVLVEYSQVAQLKDLLILVIFCVAFLVSC